MLTSEFLKTELRKVLETDLSRAESWGDFSVMVSQRPEFGDYTTNLAFVLAKARQQSPFLIAEDVKKDLPVSLKEKFDRIEIKNGYLNFFLSKKFLVEFLGKDVKSVLKPKKQKKVIVEYSSPNIGKQLSIAHIRSTIIGDALARVYKLMGWKVLTDSHLGDWGMMAGKLIAAYKKYSKTPLLKLEIKEMHELYVRLTTSEKDDPSLTELAKEETVKLQKHEKESMKIWQALVKNSLTEFAKDYKTLNILPFNFQHGESFYQEYSEKVVKDFEKEGWAKQSQGALIVDLSEENLPVVLIRKTDEAFLYATSDLGTIIQREKAYEPDLVLYVVANEQALHFEQVFAVAKKFKLFKKTELVHVKFGMLLGGDKKKLSTRKGRTILLGEVINEAVTRAERIASAKNPKLSKKDLEIISRVIAISSVKYNDLSQNRNTDIVFDWDKMLSLDGNSAPYVLYSFSRLNNILVKAKYKQQKLGLKDIEALSEEETGLLRKLTQFPETVNQAAQEFLPNLIANYVFELSSMANSFYEKYPVLTAEAKQKQARLKMIALVVETIKKSLSLFGIETLKRI